MVYKGFFVIMTRENKTDLNQIDRIGVRVSEYIQIPPDPPRMILIVGPCRTGTTALGNVFAQTGLETYMQPVKSIRRAITASGQVPFWEIDTKSDIVASKETLGPDEYFDPVQILVDRGYPPEKIHLIAILRDPATTLTSWNRMWETTDVHNLVRSIQMTADIKGLAESLGVATTAYVHEAIRDNPPREVVARLFAKLNGEQLSASASAVDWNNAIGFGAEGSNIVLFDEPPEKFVDGIKSWGGYQYRELQPQISEQEAETLQNSGVYEIYSRFAHEMYAGLGI